MVARYTVLPFLHIYAATQAPVDPGQPHICRNDTNIPQFLIGTALAKVAARNIAGRCKSPSYLMMAQMASTTKMTDQTGVDHGRSEQEDAA